MLVHSPKITRQIDDLFLSFPLVGRDELREAQKLVADFRKNEKPLELTLKQARKRRSVDANAFMWVLCQALAEVLQTSKEAVYRSFVRDYGQFYTTTCSTEDVIGITRAWAKNGTGWVSEYTNNFDGTATVLLYPGSSTYDSKQMSRLIDALCAECEDLGLTVQIPPEVEALLNEPVDR